MFLHKCGFGNIETVSAGKKKATAVAGIAIIMESTRVLILLAIAAYCVHPVHSNDDDDDDYYADDYSGGDDDEATAKSGCTGNCFSGSGTFVFHNGDKYSGAWRSGKRHGQGTYVYGEGPRMGIQYTGQWKLDHQHGEGVLQYPDGRMYRGSFVNDEMNGQGKMPCLGGRKGVPLGVAWNPPSPMAASQAFSNKCRYASPCVVAPCERI